MATNVFSGARTIFRVNDKQVAYASGCDGSIEIMYEAADVLDNLEVAEYVPVGYRVTFNCAIFRTIAGTQASTGTKLGPTKYNGDGSIGSIMQTAVGIFPRNTGTPSEILTNGYISASVVDRLTQTPVMKLEEVKAQSYNFSVTARGIVGQNVSFNAIRAKDESF